VIREIPLSQGMFALVDSEDAEAVLQHKWYAHRDRRTFYVVRMVRRANGTQAKVRLHAFLTGWSLVDHINGNGLDNRRVNLRAATRSQNAANRGPTRDNTSGFKGVTWNKQARKWRAKVKADGMWRHLGYHVTAEAAARAYDAAARELFGEFARLNFPDAAS
jgi:hypothetical protein